MKTTILTILLALSGLAYAYHGHAWIKENEVQGSDSFGNPVTICTWVCISDYRNKHQTQTQGRGFCPYPS